MVCVYKHRLQDGEAASFPFRSHGISSSGQQAKEAGQEGVTYPWVRVA